jgi:hypothetical protein
MKKKRCVQKAAMGLQRVVVPPEYAAAEQLGSTLGLAGQGASLGMTFGGPVGAAIGGGAGLLVGAIGTQLKANSINAARQQAMQENMRRAEVERMNLGREPSQISPTLYQDGTQHLETPLAMAKPIEVEKGELLFGKDPETGNIYLIQDFKNAKPHTKGGKVITAKSGQFIAPAAKREEFLRAWEQRDQAKLERLRLELPRDRVATKQVLDAIAENNPNMEPPAYQPVEQAKKGKRIDIPKYKKGTSGFEAYQDGGPIPFLYQDDTPYYTNPFPGLTPYTGDPSWMPQFVPPVPAYQPSNTMGSVPAATEYGQYGNVPYATANPVLQPAPAVPQPQVQLQTQPQATPTVTPFGAVAQGLTQLPNVYNSLRGFLERPEVVQPIVTRPEEQMFVDRYNPQRRQVLEQQRLAMAQVAGGNPSVMAANQAIIAARSAGMQNQINSQAANEALGIDAANLQLRNQFAQQRDQEMRRVEDLNARSKAAVTQFQTQAMTGIGQTGADLYRNMQMQQRNFAMERAQDRQYEMLAQRDASAAIARLEDNPDYVAYLTDDRIDQIFGMNPQLAQAVKSMRDHLRQNGYTRPALSSSLGLNTTNSLWP